MGGSLVGDCPMTTSPALTVYYDGSCPLCQREISWYRRLQGAENIHWEDISKFTEGEVTSGLCVADAMQRFHVEKQDGSIVSGALGFAEVWKQLRFFKLAGYAISLPIMRSIAEIAYRGFLKLRPLLQRFLTRKLTG